MNAHILRLSTILIALLATTGAHAGYRCDPAPTAPNAIDRRACEAAKQGPDALRQLVQRLRPIQLLDMNDYVNEATLLAWEQREQAAKLAANQR